MSKGRLRPAGNCRPRSNAAGLGSAVLYTIVLSPIILLTLALAVEAGALQLEKQRLRSAADVATVSAAAAAASQSAVGHIDARTADLAARQALSDNLAPLSGVIAAGTPEDIAANAEIIVVTTVPAADPLDPTRTLQQPTLETRIKVPVRAGLLALAGLPQVQDMTIESSSLLRVHGPPGSPE